MPREVTPTLSLCSELVFPNMHNGKYSFGGAVLSAGGTLRMTDSNLSDNWSECSNLYGTGCGSHGGAASVAQLGTLEMSSCHAQRNVANCTVASGCTDGSGGAGVDPPTVSLF